MISQQECANAIRALAMDAVQKANSGHPGMPMGMADIAEVLWRQFLNFNPNNPAWPNRDRFILSNGHGAMLQYALLHLTGFDLSIEDIQQFRELHAKTPGHPEYGETPGVEATTGPLGQGLANGVGMAIAEQILAAQFNRENFPIIDHYTYVFAGDGCMMEGISHEACSLAGTLGLNKLIVFWDDNGISIDGEVDGWFTDNTPQRFLAYHWHVIPNVDGHDSEAIQKAILEAKAETNKPTLICCKTEIAHGAPNLVNSAQAHGSPLGLEEIAATRSALNWSHPPFVIPEEIYQAWDAREKGQFLEDHWNVLFAKYESRYPELAKELLRRWFRAMPNEWENKTQAFIQTMQSQAKDNATRQDSLQCIEFYSTLFPELLGGSADLSGSNGTQIKEARILSKSQRNANYIKYGVREFAMSAILNGLALHGGFIPFGGTFLVFSDYARNAVRLAALMKQKVIFVYSHDSIGLGEDGPTHQPIEHLSMLRMTPGLRVWRPSDGTETAVAWQQSLLHQGPSCLVLTRQKVPHLLRTERAVSEIAKGAYVLWDPTQKLDGIFLATGSEVHLALLAAQALAEKAIYFRVVSMPCCESFKKQDALFRESVLPPDVRYRIAIEAAATDYWYQFVGDQGLVLGIDQFGASAPAKDLFQFYGLTVNNIVSTVLQNKIKLGALFYDI